MVYGWCIFNSRAQVAKTNWPLLNDLKSLQRLSTRVLHIVDQAGQRGKPAFCHYQSGLGNVDCYKYQLACEPSSTGISSAHESQYSQNPSFPVKHFYFSDALNHHFNCISVFHNPKESLWKDRPLVVIILHIGQYATKREKPCSLLFLFQSSCLLLGSDPQFSSHTLIYLTTKTSSESS